MRPTTWSFLRGGCCSGTGGHPSCRHATWFHRRASPPVRVAEVRTIPRRAWLGSRGRVRDTGNIARPTRLVIEAHELFFTELVEDVLVETGKSFDAIASEIRNNDVPVAVE